MSKVRNHYLQGPSRPPMARLGDYHTLSHYFMVSPRKALLYALDLSLNQTGSKLVTSLTPLSNSICHVVWSQCLLNKCVNQDIVLCQRGFI